MKPIKVNFTIQVNTEQELEYLRKLLAPKQEQEYTPCSKCAHHEIKAKLLPGNRGLTMVYCNKHDCETQPQFTCKNFKYRERG